MSVNRNEEREKAAKNPENCLPFQLQIRKDISDLKLHLISIGSYERFQNLRKPLLWLSLFNVITDWCMIFVVCVIYKELGIYSLPFILLVVGNRQRALGNMLHEASHKNFGSRKHLADWISSLLIALPLFSPLYFYRELHNSHHRNLGCPSGDVDLINDASRSDDRWHQILFKHMFSFEMWKSSTFGLFLKVNAISHISIFIWWLAFLTILSYLTSLEFSSNFLFIWFLSRATTFHGITVFREIADHVGLKPGNIIGFTRNNPTQGLLRIVFHPHNNGYHLIHHLDPSIPFFALPKAHELLLDWSRYAEAEHCDGYFFGLNPVIHSWENRQKKSGATSEVSNELYEKL
jgi:fatty acid desaturase